MESVSSVWAGLSAGRRLVVILATVGMFAAVLFLSRGVGAADLTLLYANLDEASAGGVIAALDQQGIPYEVRGAAIFVPRAERDQLRLSLAAEGLPANSSQGYELLDSLTGFGTTSQMFDAAYWRAKEGELARTMLASAHIQAARVHISAPSNRPFQRDMLPTAAVTVGTVNGVLSQPQADALRYLVASSVPGLSPENVAVIDGEGGLVSAADTAPAGGAQTRSEDLRARAERLLEARVGVGNAIVEVSVETVTETEAIVERVIDPDSRIAISTEVEERSNSSQDSRGGDVTVASNLPAGDGDGTDGTAASEDAETRSITNYEISETSREVVRGPGAIRRLTVAVLVNDAVEVDDAGVAQSVPRSEQELEALSALVSSAVGLDAARGDVITIQSMAFEPIEPLGTEAADVPEAPLNMMALIQMGVLAAVALILGLFVVRPILASKPAQAASAGALPSPAPGEAGGAAPPAIGGPMTALPPVRNGSDELGIADLRGDPAASDPVSRLRQMIEEREDETIQILQSWIEDPNDKEEA